MFQSSNQLISLYLIPNCTMCGIKILVVVIFCNQRVPKSTHDVDFNLQTKNKDVTWQVHKGFVPKIIIIKDKSTMVGNKISKVMRMPTKTLEIRLKFRYARTCKLWSLLRFNDCVASKKKRWLGGWRREGKFLVDHLYYDKVRPSWRNKENATIAWPVCAKGALEWPSEGHFVHEPRAVTM